MFSSLHTGNIASSVSFSLQDANYAYPTRQGILRKIRACERLQKFFEHEQASTPLLFATNLSKGQILRALSNWMDHLMPLIMSMFANKTPRGDKHVSKYFQTATALKHRNAKLLNSIRISTLHFKILKNKPAVTSNVRQTETAGPSNAMRYSQ